MAHTPTVSDKILQIMRRYPDCSLNELVLACDGFPWHEVLIGVHSLSEDGKVRLTPISYGSCTVRLVTHQQPGTRKARPSGLHGGNGPVPSH